MFAPRAPGLKEFHVLYIWHILYCIHIYTYDVGAGIHIGRISSGFLPSPLHPSAPN